MKRKQRIGNSLVSESKLRNAMELFPGKTRDEVRELLRREVVGRIKLGGCLAGIFLLLAVFAGNSKSSVSEIERELPGGMGKPVRVQVVTKSGPQELLVEVGAREYEPGQIEELHREAETYLERVMPGENETLEKVTKALYFPEILPETNGEVEWTTDAPWLITSKGEVLNVDITGPEQVMVTAKIWYGSEFRHFSKAVMVYPVEYSKEEKELREIQMELVSMEETSRMEELFVLPEEVQGYKVFPAEDSGNNSGFFLILLSVVLPFFLYYGYFEKLEKERKKRKERAERCYMEFVTKFSVLLAAGVSARQVVYRLAEEYEKNYGAAHVLTEELKVCRQELEQGYSETVAYESFGRRMGVLAYRRMSSLLSQNVTKGVQGMRNLLLLEAKEVMAQEKANIRQKGEQAGTKLLLPMMGLLFLVFAILLVPAFQSF